MAGGPSKCCFHPHPPSYVRIEFDGWDKDDDEGEEEEDDDDARNVEFYGGEEPRNPKWGKDDGDEEEDDEEDLRRHRHEVLRLRVLGHMQRGLWVCWFHAQGFLQ